MKFYGDSELMELITSSKNTFVKRIKSLKLRKNREKEGLFIVEGLRFVEEGIKAGAEFNSIILTDSFYNKIKNNSGANTSSSLLAGYLDMVMGMDKEKGGAVVVADYIFQDMCETDNPQGVMGIVKAMNGEGLEDMDAITRDRSFVVVLDTLQDPGNMGTVIRTAHAAGACCIIVSEGCVDVYNPKTLRATMGSVFHVPVINGGKTAEIVRVLQKAGYKVYASHLKGDKSIYEMEYNGKVAVIIGNEGRGISDEVAEAADCLVKIPMPGGAESLNASVAAGLLIYEVVRSGHI